jgi:hypothetical protein
MLFHSLWFGSYHDFLDRVAANKETTEPRVCSKSNTSGVTSDTGTDYLSGVPDFFVMFVVLDI